MYDIRVTRGDSTQWIKLLVTESDGVTAVNLTGFTAKVTVKKYYDTLMKDAIIDLESGDDTSNFDMTHLADGEVYFKFLPGDTEGQNPASHKYDIEVANGDRSKVYTFPKQSDDASFYIEADASSEESES